MGHSKDDAVYTHTHTKNPSENENALAESAEIFGIGLI